MIKEESCVAVREAVRSRCINGREESVLMIVIIIDRLTPSKRNFKPKWFATTALLLREEMFLLIKKHRRNMRMVVRAGRRNVHYFL